MIFQCCWLLFKHTSLNPVPNAQMCVCIWWYILQNYNYKLHFQNLSIYHILHVSIGTLATENHDVCTACDPWDSNLQLTIVNNWRLGPGMPFIDSDTCARRGGGGVNLFLPGFSSLYDAIHGWMTGRMDGWMKKASRPRRPLLYVCTYYIWWILKSLIEAK
jgi:hypothetical protein